MNWKKLFAPHILSRGYDYYYENAVENLDISTDSIKADVIGTEEYEVEISIDDEEITDMYCSCPYAEKGNNCKHMAAVLYEWKNGQYGKGLDTNTYNKKVEEINKLIKESDIDIVYSYLASILIEDEKLLLRFQSMLNKHTTEEDIKRYIVEVDNIIESYLEDDNFINYYEAGSFLSELNEILDKDVQRMIDNTDYMSAFKLMNYIFTSLGDVDMDDSDGGIEMLADVIYQLWLELLTHVNADEKRKMFHWFTKHLDGSISDYLEEYIEQVIMDKFSEKEYEQSKLHFIEDMIHKSASKASDWSRSYEEGKWAIRYLEMIEKQENSKLQIEEFCRKYWNNSSVREYYIDFCIDNKEYDRALETLDESISMDKEYRGLISSYEKKKKEIYILQGNKKAYIKQLWKLALKYQAGDLDIYNELKKQYTTEEWIDKREELFQKLPEYANIDQLYKEEKLYDRLFKFVMESNSLHLLQKYEDVLKQEYSEQILQKYKEKVNDMAANTGDRKKYQQLVELLRRMMKIKGGSKVVEDIVTEWKIQYKKRPAMMDELKKL